MPESSCSPFLCARMFKSLHLLLFRTRCRSASSKRYQKRRDLERAARHRERMAAIAATPAPPSVDPPAPAQPDSVVPCFPSKSNEVFCTSPPTTSSEAGDQFEPNAADEVTSPWEEELEQLRATVERQTAELQRADDYLAWIKAENRKLDKQRRAAIEELDKAEDDAAKAQAQYQYASELRIGVILRQMNPAYAGYKDGQIIYVQDVQRKAKFAELEAARKRAAAVAAFTTRRKLKFSH